jgi:hypothetical protein
VASHAKFVDPADRCSEGSVLKLAVFVLAATIVVGGACSGGTSAAPTTSTPPTTAYVPTTRDSLSPMAASAPTPATPPGVFATALPPTVDTVCQMVVALANAGPPAAPSPEGVDGYLAKLRDLAQQERNPQGVQQIAVVRQRLADWAPIVQNPSASFSQRNDSHQAVADSVKPLSAMCPMVAVTAPPPTTPPSPQ